MNFINHLFSKKPKACHKVKLVNKKGTVIPLGISLRNEIIFDVTHGNGNEEPKVERSQGVVISKILSGGLAESAIPKLVIGDEIIEVNGMEIEEKSARQVKDMMIAIYNNRSDLIITVKTPSSPCELLNHEMTPPNCIFTYCKKSKLRYTQNSYSMISFKINSFIYFRSFFYLSDIFG